MRVFTKTFVIAKDFVRAHNPVIEVVLTRGEPAYAVLKLKVFRKISSANRGGTGKFIRIR